MKKALIAIVLTVSLVVTFAACGNSDGSSTTAATTDKKAAATDAVVTESESNPDVTKGENTDVSNDTTAEAADKLTYQMAEYTKAPNEKSSIKIKYPEFSGVGAEQINSIITDEVESFAKIDTGTFSADSALTVDYDAQVTLNNASALSIVFWGSSNIETTAHPTTNLNTLNIDLKTMKDIKLTDLYKIDSNDGEFQQIFFEKAYFPENPVTSYDKESFDEMLKIQTPENLGVSPFSSLDSVSFYLTEDSIVLSFPAVHATGSDHFEAAVKYANLTGVLNTGAYSFMK